MTCCSQERTLFMRLGILVGGCRLDAAEAVCDSDDTFGATMLDSLDSLIEKSLPPARGLRRRAALLDARDDPGVRT
jgi:predicted ATPase